MLYKSESLSTFYPATALHHSIAGLQSCQEDLEDLYPVNTNQHRSETLVSSNDDLKALLLDYSRAIIHSTVDYSPQQADNLEKAITSARDKVIDLYQSRLEDSEMLSTVAKARIGQLQDKIAKEEQELLARNEEWKEDKESIIVLKRDLVEARCDKERYKRAWEGDEGVRSEHKEMKEDKRRRREKAVKVWEKAEKVKLEQVNYGG